MQTSTDGRALDQEPCAGQDGSVRKEGLMREMRRVWVRLRVLLVTPTGWSVHVSLRGMQTLSYGVQRVYWGSMPVTGKVERGKLGERLSQNMLQI